MPAERVLDRAAPLGRTRQRETTRRDGCAPDEGPALLFRVQLEYLNNRDPLEGGTAASERT